jgi:copper chaperone CopZ
MSVAVISIAWYLKLKPSKKEMNCTCGTDGKTPVIQPKGFLVTVTFFSFLMMTFPLYADMFYSKKSVATVCTLDVSNRQDITFSIHGMTCAACAEHVNNELAKVDGVLSYLTTHRAGNSLVSFDASKVEIRDIEIVINKTGYQVTGHHVAVAPNSQDVNSFWLQSPYLTYPNDQK